MWKQCSYRLKSQFILEGNRLVLNCRVLPHPQGKAIYLRFQLKNADLYTIQIQR